MRRKLILIFLSLAIFSSVFTVFAFALDGEITDADEAIEVEKKKLSEFTDAELLEYLSDKDMARMGSLSDVTFWDYIRRIIVMLEDDINCISGGHTTTFAMHREDMRLIVEEYYGIKSDIDAVAKRAEILEFRKAHGLDVDSLYTK